MIEERIPRYRRPLDYYLLWLVAAISIGLNLVVINALLQARRQAGVTANNAADAVSQFRTAVIDYPLEIHEQLPISLTLEYDETVAVPISTTLPIDTEISVPLETPFGAIPLTFPVVTDIPIRITPEVPLKVSLPVSLSVPVDLAIPIRIDVGATPLGASLVELENYLRRVGRELGGAPPAVITPTTTIAPTRTR